MFRFLFIISAFSSAIIFAQPTTASGSLEVNQWLASFDAAWNSHNPQALSALWMKNGDLITPWGRWIMSQEQVEKHFSKEMAGSLSKMTIQQSIDSSRMLTPEYAFVDATIKLHGIADSKGEAPPPVLQHGVYVLKKIDHQWKIAAARMYLFESSSSE